MDGDTQTTSTAASPVASVLGDDNLFREILLSLGFPTCLVRAALVSKRWLLHVSDPDFLRRFRERHPRRLLGLCVGYPCEYQFVSLPQPPEHAAHSRRAASSCDDVRGSLRINHCRNGLLITESFNEGPSKHDLLLSLLTGEPAAVLPPASDWEERLPGRFKEMFLPVDGGRDGITMVHLSQVGRKVCAEVSVLGSGGWGAPVTAVIEIEPPYRTPYFIEVLPPVHGKIFMVTTAGYTLGLDLVAAAFFILELPAGVRHNYMLSCAVDSGLYLVNADGLQLSVWLHPMAAAGGWVLLDTFCVHDAFTRLAGDSSGPHANFVDVVAIGDDADFVFLDHPAPGALFSVHLRSRVVEKVYQREADETGYYRGMCNHIQVCPIMMIWPPIVPARKVGLDQEE